MPRFQGFEKHGGETKNAIGTVTRPGNNAILIVIRGGGGSCLVIYVIILFRKAFRQQKIIYYSNSLLSFSYYDIRFRIKLWLEII